MSSLVLLAQRFQIQVISSMHPRTYHPNGTALDDGDTPADNSSRNVVISIPDYPFSSIYPSVENNLPNRGSPQQPPYQVSYGPMEHSYAGISPGLASVENNLPNRDSPQQPPYQVSYGPMEHSYAGIGPRLASVEDYLPNGGRHSPQQPPYEVFYGDMQPVYAGPGPELSSPTDSIPQFRQPTPIMMKPPQLPPPMVRFSATQAASRVSLNGHVPETRAEPVHDTTAEGSIKDPSNQKRTNTVCGCRCKSNCNCECACETHCYCRHENCTSNCKDRPIGRNLVLSIDGTANTFCTTNTNVVELHSHVERFVGDGDAGVEQLKCYLSGIGTTLPPSRLAISHWQVKLANVLDLAFALRFSKIVQDAYRWLMENYKPGDRIYLFGFSRGAYQVRALAGMIDSLGLLESGNRTLIPFAYDFYTSKYQELQNGSEKAKHLAQHFKTTFSIPTPVKVHFIGAWDTVSSIGLRFRTPLPLANSVEHICFFRHALALDERRVKFIPEYLERSPALASILPTGAPVPVEPSSAALPPNTFKKGGTTVEEAQGGSAGRQTPSVAARANTLVAVPPPVKEVWFAGSHSDIGGGYKENVDLDNSLIPLLWMKNEAKTVGLHFKSMKGSSTWNLQEITEKPTESMSWLWWLLEYLPVTVWKPLAGSPPFDWLAGFRFRSKVVEADTALLILGEGALVPESPLSKTTRIVLNYLTNVFDRYFRRLRPDNADDQGDEHDTRGVVSRKVASAAKKQIYILTWLVFIWGRIFSFLNTLWQFLLHPAAIEGATILPHRGRGRIIQEGQLIHASVAFKPRGYVPKANFATPMEWDRLVGTAKFKGTNLVSLSWPRELEPRLEKDLFDESLVEARIDGYRKRLDGSEREISILQELSFMALASSGADTMWVRREFRETILNDISTTAKLRVELLELLSRILTHASALSSVPLEEPWPEDPEFASATKELKVLLELLATLATLPLCSSCKPPQICTHGEYEFDTIKGVLSCLNPILARSRLLKFDEKRTSQLLLNIFDVITQQMPMQPHVERSPLGSSQLDTKSSIRLWPTSWFHTSVKQDPEDAETKAVRLRCNDVHIAIVNLTLRCLAASGKLGDQWLFTEGLNTSRLLRISGMLFDHDTRLDAIELLIPLASTEAGRDKMFDATLYDSLIRVLSIQDHTFFHRVLECLTNFALHDDARTKVFLPITKFCESILRLPPATLKPRFRYHAALALQKLFSSDWDFKSRTYPPQEIYSCLLSVVTAGNYIPVTPITVQSSSVDLLDINLEAENEGARLMSADALTSLLGAQEDMVLSESEITGLLDLIHIPPPESSRTPLVSALKACDGQRQDLRMSYSVGDLVDSRMMALGLLSALSKHESNVVILRANIESVLSAFKAIVVSCDSQLLRWGDYWHSRLINYETLRKPLGNGLVKMTVGLAKSAKLQRATRSYTIEMWHNFAYEHSEDLEFLEWVGTAAEKLSKLLTGQEVDRKLSASLFLAGLLEHASGETMHRCLQDMRAVVENRHLKPPSKTEVLRKCGAAEQDIDDHFGSQLYPIHFVVGPLLTIFGQSERLPLEAKKLMLALLRDVISSEDTTPPGRHAAVWIIDSELSLKKVADDRDGLRELKRALDNTTSLKGSVETSSASKRVQQVIEMRETPHRIYMQQPFPPPIEPPTSWPIAAAADGSELSPGAEPPFEMRPAMSVAW